MADNLLRYGWRWSVAANGRACPPGFPMVVADAYGGSLNSIDVDLNVGDLVKRVSTGTIEHADGNETTTESVMGVVVGIIQYWDGSVIRSGSKVPNGSTGGGLYERQTRVLVVPAGWGIWEADVDVSAAAYDTRAEYQAFVGENVDHINVANATTDKANPRIDISTHATTESLVWNIVGISPTHENQDFSGEYVKLLLAINNWDWPGQAATRRVGI